MASSLSRHRAVPRAATARPRLILSARMALGSAEIYGADHELALVVHVSAITQAVPYQRAI